MLPNIHSHIHSYEDLITSRAAIRDGFLKQALTKTRRAAPFIQQAQEFAAVLQAADAIETLAGISTPSIKAALFAAAGFSDKARGKLGDAELEPALAEVLEHIRQHSPNAWREELVYRFLLTRGDTLGGSLRNTAGAAGGAQFSRAVIKALETISVQPTVTYAAKNQQKIASLQWPNRLLLFDKKPVFLNNNIDVILLNTEGSEPNSHTIEMYLACGELKGGIDPAGADEHWKTAQSAFDRIRNQFSGRTLPAPDLFFVGAAIEPTMARQIFAQLEAGLLAHAANLTIPQQVSDLADWLIGL